MELLMLCLKIFLVRIVDVSLGTIRTLITVKGGRKKATCIAFFEALIWFLVVKEALTTDLQSIWIAFAYASGFASGTFLGSYLSSKFLNEIIEMQVIISNKKIIQILRDCGYALSVVDVKGQDNKKKYLLLIEVHYARYNEVLNLIKSVEDNAFIVVSDTKYVINGYFGK